MDKSEYSKKYYEANKDKMGESTKKYREKNKDKITEYKKKYREENKDKIRESTRKYYEANKPKIGESTKKYREENKDKIRESIRKYREENKDKRIESSRKYYEANKDKIREYREENKDKIREYSRKYLKEYTKIKYKKDPNFKLKRLLRSRLLTALKNNNIKKTSKSAELLGCTIQEAREHIEKQFKEGMTWDNHGFKEWHIDHIMPCSSFDLTDPDQQKKCFHYTNLQPLWANENMSKGAKIL